VSHPVGLYGPLEGTLGPLIPGESLSRVASYDWFGSLAFYPLGFVIWGPVAAAIGVSTALWIAFGLFLAGIAIQLAVPDTRRLRADPVATLLVPANAEAA